MKWRKISKRLNKKEGSQQVGLETPGWGGTSERMQKM